MVDTELSLNDFMTAIRPTVEADVDEQIEAEPDPVGRRLLRQHRGVLISKALDHVRIRNLEHRNRELEARLTPRLVE